MAKNSSSLTPRELINISGFPFQHSCAYRINKLMGFEIAQEVPFTFPRTQGAVLGSHGTIDLLATHVSAERDDLLNCYVIETKKANVVNKKWLFFENKIKNPKWPLFVFEAMAVPGAAVSRSPLFPDLGYGSLEAYQYCSNGIEVDDNFTNLNSNQQEKIYKSLSQVAHATRGMVDRVKAIEGLTSITRKQYNFILYIPVVVTTAELYIPTYNVAKVENGEMDAQNFNLGEPRKWLTYDLPLADYMSYPVRRDVGLNVNLDLYAERLTVFVVNDKHLEEFLQNTFEVRNPLSAPTKS